MKTNKTIKWIAISIFALLLLGWIFIPIIAKNYAINNSKELLGRQIDIDRLRFNFFTGNMHMNGFRMFEPDERTVFVSFDTLNVNIEPYQFIFNKKVVEQFYLQGLSVNVILKDSVYNFDDLVAFHTAGSDTIAEEENQEPFKYILSNLELKDADFSFEDQNVPHTTNIDELSFFIPYISWDQEEKSNADLRFDFKRGGYFESSINVNPVDGEYDAKITIDQLFLDLFLKRIQEYAQISSIEGFVNTKLEFHGNINVPEKSLLSGRIEVMNLAMTDKDSQKFLASEKSICVLKEFDVSQDSYHIDSLRLDNPFLLFELDSVSNNVFRIFKLDSVSDESEEPKTETKTETDSVAHSGLFYAIDHFNMNSGVIDYTDNLTGKPFHYHLSEINIETDSIYSNADWVEINADMLLNERGTLKAQIGFDPVDYLDGSLKISVEKFLLPDLNIYTNHYAGHTMVEGDMFYYSDSKLINGNIESENKLTIKQPTVTNSEGGLYSLPLKLALWLLTDKNGDVNLNVPVRGDLNDPEIDMWKLVWSTLRNKITDTADNPVVSLAPLVGADPKELESIDFSFTDTLVTDQHVKQLNWLVELEKIKKGLTIDLKYFDDHELEAASINGMQTQTDSVNTNVSEAEPSIGKTVAEQYSNARIKSIRNTLDSLDANTLINIIEWDSLSPENTGSTPLFKIKFSMINELDSLN
jgi:hypothetical protein